MVLRRLLPTLGASCILTGSALADDNGLVVVRVGEATLTIAEVEARLARVPSFQLRALAETEALARHTYVDTVLVPEYLFSLEARRRGLGDAPAARDRILEVLRDAVLEDLEQTVQRSQPVSAREVEEYLASHREQWIVPKRIRLWRILVKSPDQAREIAAAAQGPKGVEAWSRSAREHSLDKATSMRKGDLGFVRPDGRTDVPTVRVDPALVAAADKVRDGEVVSEIIPEAGGYAVVWRRGSLPAEPASNDALSAEIREALERDRLQEALDKLLQELRSRRLPEVHPELLEQVPLPSAQSLRELTRPELSVHPADHPPSPHSGPTGLR